MPRAGLTQLTLAGSATRLEVRQPSLYEHIDRSFDRLIRWLNPAPAHEPTTTHLQP